VKDRFNLIFMSAVTLTVLCGILMGAIAIYGPNPQPPPIASLFDTLKYLFTVGGLSILTLLGTRAPLRSSPPKKEKVVSPTENL
jgi:hypothetical protein